MKLRNNKTGKILKNIMAAAMIAALAVTTMAASAAIITTATPIAPIFAPISAEITPISASLDELDENVIIDRFNEDFICSNNNLKLNITDEIEIIFEDGTKFEGEIEELAGRKLMVHLGMITTASMPGINTPTKIVVMFEQAVNPIFQLTAEDIRLMMLQYEDAIVRVNGEILENRAFVSENNKIMVALRETAYALDLEPVTWFADTKTVQVGRNLSFSIGQDYYSFGRMAPTSLGQEPKLKNSLTFVPIDLFAHPLLGGRTMSWMSTFDEELDATVIDLFFIEMDMDMDMDMETGIEIGIGG